ncbi:MAG TPA: DJ-1/PfpI family protein [Candidatus Binataceae bacterium]|nr:DJ-1/PfpI family protein [Candidatus Binataceae bacterium]
MANTLTVAAILFPGFELLDVFGPLEAFGMLAESGKCKVLTVGEKGGAVASRQGPRTATDHGFDDCPPLDIFLVPGGLGTRDAVSNDRFLNWIRERAQSARFVMSVCTGTALLARAGLLDGRNATTNKFAFKWVAEQGPKVNWIKQARWVEDGKFWTSSGVSAGIDMTLALIAKLEDLKTAELIANRMEYDWHRDASWDPFAKIHGLV